MNILVIGKGGREHAIAWKFSQDSRVKNVFVIPGSSAMDNHKIKSVDINALDFPSAIEFAKTNNIYLTLVGPEVELEKGIVDAFEKEGLKIFGPNKYCAQIESSKSFAKSKMEKYNIPTASHFLAHSKEEAVKYLETQSFPIVFKADGLAAGKGVFIPTTKEDADKYLDQVFAVSPNVLIEEFLEGEEFSLLAFVNNKTISYMQIAQDYKRAFDNDQGENTGGMGAYTPITKFSTSQINEGKEIIRKLINGLSDDQTPYKGIIYAGCMATKNGVKTIEFNARFGDPETEVILLAMEDELLDILENVMNEKEHEIKWSNKTYIGVVIASEGYPGSYKKSIKLPLTLENTFSMGIKKEGNDLLSDGGRVAFVYESGNSLEEAKKKVYDKLKQYEFNGFFYRKDIGK